MKPHHYKLEVVEINAMDEFENLIHEKDSEGQIIKTLDEEQQKEVREKLEGKVFVKLILEDSEYGNNLVMPSPLIEPDQAGYWAVQMIKTAQKKIASLVDLKNKAQESSIFLPNGNKAQG